MTVAQYFEIKVAFTDELIFDEGNVREAAERFEKSVIIQLRERLPEDSEADIRLYGNPAAGCFYDSAWVVVGGIATTGSLLAIGGRQLLEAVEASVFSIWHGNVSEMCVRVGPVVESPPDDITNEPSSGPFETYVRVPSQNDRVRDRTTEHHSDHSHQPAQSISNGDRPRPAMLSFAQIGLIIFALLAGVGYVVERTSDTRNVNAILERLTKIEAAVERREPVPVNVECQPAEVRVSCPSPNVVRPSAPRRYSSGG